MKHTITYCYRLGYPFLDWVLVEDIKVTGTRIRTILNHSDEYPVWIMNINGVDTSLMLEDEIRLYVTLLG